MNSIKPFDAILLLDSGRKTGRLLVVENHQQRNGLAYELCHTLILASISSAFYHLGLADTFAESGHYGDVIDEYKIDSESIVEKCKAPYN
nr:transketolase C-terminal domain-containing protein [Sphaerochaeta pleomorpha]